MRIHVIVRYVRFNAILDLSVLGEPKHVHTSHTLHFYRLNNFLKWCNSFNKNEDGRFIYEITFVEGLK